MIWRAPLYISKSLRASYSGGFSLGTVLECQPHLMPRHIPMRGLVGHALVLEAELCVVVDKPVLASQDKTFAALLFRVGNRLLK